MLILPAIDLKDGEVVRFVQGRHSKTVYSQDPVKTAKHWVKQGARMLHIVDLDGAMTGIVKNMPLVKEIVSTVDVGVEFGGGVRDIGIVRQLLTYGVKRVILGTRAIEDKVFLESAVKEFGDQVIVSIDARDGRVMIKGWVESAASLDVQEYCARLLQIGIQRVIYTDVSKDGTLQGPNISGVKGLLKLGMSVIASGGISSLGDLKKLKTLEKKGVAGIIIGKALYEGKFTLSQALKICN